MFLSRIIVIDTVSGLSRVPSSPNSPIWLIGPVASDADSLADRQAAALDQIARTRTGLVGTLGERQPPASTPTSCAAEIVRVLKPNGLFASGCRSTCQGP